MNVAPGKWAAIPFTVGDQGGGATGSVDIPVTGLTVPGRYPYQFRLASPGRSDLVYDGVLALVRPDAVRPVPRKTITVDGVLDDLAGIDAIDMADGAVKINNYGGPADLSGQIWVTWDDENLYLAASITDDAHGQPATSEGIWVGDSIQFAITPGTPGESVRYYEYGIVLTGSGPQAFRWSSIGPSVGPVTGVTLRVARDEPSMRTVYELAMPWDEVVRL